MPLTKPHSQRLQQLFTGVSICTFVPVSKYFCTSKASAPPTSAAPVRRGLLHNRAQHVSICTCVLVNQVNWVIFVLIKQVNWVHATFLLESCLRPWLLLAEESWFRFGLRPPVSFLLLTQQSFFSVCVCVCVCVYADIVTQEAAFSTSRACHYVRVCTTDIYIQRKREREKERERGRRS